jgi:alpha-1,3-mannosyltransferase
MAQIQVAIAIPFLQTNAWGYLGRAFEFSRQFLFKWTVNWRFVGEDAFLSRSFSLVLLGLHVTILLAFITGRWLRPAGKPIADMIKPLFYGLPPFTDREERQVSKAITPRYVMTTILTANAIGLLFARSLHYQFYAYIAWCTPFLLWRSGLHPILQYLLWILQEWAWNVFPSTPLSSTIVVSMLAVSVAGVWWKTSGGQQPQPAMVKDEASKR